MSDAPAIADMHVHTQWSWDAPHGSMMESCRRAVELGLPGIAFTEHADFVEIFEGQRPVDITGYHECVERCRAAFPDLRIVSGIELGEPHRYPELTAQWLSAGPLERVLGSVHCIQIDGQPVDISRQVSEAADPTELVREYFREMVRLIESPERFEVLAHFDYAKRYWPAGAGAYSEAMFEEEIRAALAAAASRETVLEVNTTRGMDPARGLCPGPTVIAWWREAGGRAVSFGSDAHSPDKIAEGFRHAARVVEAAGFRPSRDPLDFWRA